MKQIKKLSPIFLILFLGLGGVSTVISQTGENQAFLYANKLYDEGMYSLAASQFRSFMETYPTSPRAPEALFMAGESYLKLEKYHEAQQAYLEMTMRYPEAPKTDEAQMKIGDCYRALQDYTKAANAYQRVKIFYPKSNLAPGSMIASARMSGLAGNYSAAITTYYDFLDEYPQAPDGFQVKLELIEILMKKGELKRALAESEKLSISAFKVDNKVKAKYYKGLIYEEMGQISQAQEEYHAIVAQSTDQSLLAKTYLRLGYIYRLKGEWERSSEFFTKSLASEGGQQVQIETYLMLGDNYLDLNNYANAQTFFEKVIETAPKDEASYLEALYKSGLAYENLADYKSANRYFLRLLNEYQPTNRKGADYREQAFLKVAQNYLLLNNGTQAVNYFRKYLELYEDSNLADQINYKIGEIYEQSLDNPEKAIRLYDRFMETFPHSPYIDEAQLGIARCYEALGNYDRAIKEYRSFLGVYPGGAEYDIAEHRIRFLETYYIEDPTKALHEFSSLISGLLSQRDQTQLFFQLAEINFEYIRNYKVALQNYRTSLKHGATESLTAKILFRMGQSYQFLAHLEHQKPDGGQYMALMDSARMNYQLILDRYSDNQWADDAAIRLAELKAQDVFGNKSETARFYADALRKFPRSDHKDYMLLRLGEAILKGYYSKTDSLNSPKHYFQQLLADYPQSEYRGQAQFMLGLYHYQLTDFYAARNALKGYIENFPDGAFIVKAYDLLAKIERRQENYDKSVEYYQHIINNYAYSPNADSAYLLLGDIYLEKNDNETALNHFLSIETKFNKLSWLTFDRVRSEIFSWDELNFKVGKTYERLGDFTQAKQRYQNYLKLAPNGKYLPETLLALGRITASEGQYDKDLALGYYKRLKEEFPDQEIGYDASIKAADLLFNEQKYEESHAEYQKAVSFADSDMKMEYPQAQAIVCLYRIGKITAADNEKETFQKAFGGVANYLAQFEYEKGEYYLNQKSFNRAEKLFDNVRRKYKRTDYAPKAELSLGKLYKIQNKDEKALDILTAIPQKYPNSEIAALAYVNLGDYYIAEKQPPNAISMYKKALEVPQIGTLKPLAMRKLIGAYEIFGMSDQQLALIREFIRLYPQDKSIFDMKLKIGIIYKDTKEYAQAIALFDELLVQADPENEAEVQFRLAECYEMTGQFERAISEFLKVKYIAKQTKLPWGTTAQYLAALLYKKQSQYPEAKQLLQKIIQSRGITDNYGRVAKEQLDEIERLEATGTHRNGY